MFGNNFDKNIKPERTSPEIGFHFENDKRPAYQYFYHGTFQQFLPKILTDGFTFKEYHPNLTISPSYGFEFIASEVRKGPEQLKNRKKYLEKDEMDLFKENEMGTDKAVLLVIKPPVDYSIRTTIQGRPNVFSSLDQIPDDIDSTVRVRIFGNNQREVRVTPFTKISGWEERNKRENKELAPGDLRRPGLFLNRRRIINEQGEGEWVAYEEEDKIKWEQGKFSPQDIKLAIRKDQKFEDILQSFKQKIKIDGNISDEIINTYSQDILEYFKNHDQIKLQPGLNQGDLAEIAVSMITGELENYIISEIRKIFLDLEQLRGKKIVAIKPEPDNLKIKKEHVKDYPAPGKQSVVEKIDHLRSLHPDNKFFTKAISIYMAKFEKELSELE